MKNKAFTLVELLGVIVLLGILGVVIIPKVGDSITNSKETAYITQEEQIKKAAYDFIVDNIELFDNTNTITIKLGVLKQKGYLPINIKNPKTRKNISNESTITITKTNDKFEITLNLIDLIEVTENIDNNSPIIVLNGNYVEYINVNSNETEINNNLIQNGAKAYSSTGEELTDITTQIKINEEEKTSIKTNALDTYEITYTVTDNGKTTSATRTVIIRDTEAPQIALQKETTISANQVNGYDLREGLIITDNYDNELNAYNESKVKINSSLSNIPGKYVVTYTVTDGSGNTTTERRVIIVENTPTYIIKGKTTPSSTDTPTMENPVTYYGLGRDNYIDVIETHGKNIFNIDDFMKTYSPYQPTKPERVTFEGEEVWKMYGAVTLPGRNLKYMNERFKENTQYTFSIDLYDVPAVDSSDNNTYTGISIRFKYTDDTYSTILGTQETRISNSNKWNKIEFVSNPNKTISNIAISFGTTQAYSYIKNIQLEEGTTATPYEPYEGSTIRINLTGHDPLMCLGDNCDYIDYEKNRIVRNIGKYTVTGNENWTYRNTTEDGISTYSIASSNWILSNMNYKYYNDTKALNSYVQYDGTIKSAVDNYYSSRHFTLYYNGDLPNNRGVYINSSTISTQADFKSNLQSLYNSGKPMIIYYELAEPQYEPIDLPQVNLRWNSDTFVTDGYVTKTYN